MGTRPYATYGGHRVRQCYNRRLIEYRQRCSPTCSFGSGSPLGANAEEYEAWVLWIRAWEAALLANRNLLVEQAEQQERSKRNERKHTKRRG